MIAHPAISVQDVSVRYGDNPVLDRIQFEVNPHEIVSIVGPNGSGKTTLIRTILGLIEPFQGTVLYFLAFLIKSIIRSGSKNTG